MSDTRSSSRPGRGQAVLNVIMRTVLATPLLHRAVSNRILVIDIVGRKSGRRYRIPVGYVRTDDGLLVGTAGRWRRNLKPGQPVHVTVGRQRQDMTADVVTDERECTRLYRAILARNPVHGRYAGIRHEPDGTPNPQDMRAALDRGVAVVRLHARTWL
jgi:deazaflavin-dependent oxidoreductase (nitroreductase family)